MPYVDDKDVALLAVDVGSGWFAAADLYNWYVSSIAEEGREPVTKKRFGMKLRSVGFHSSSRNLEPGHQVRVWLVTKPWVRRGEAILAEEMAS